MKTLRHPNGGEPVAYLEDNDVEFTSNGKLLEDIMRLSGINIPRHSLSAYNGRAVVHFARGDSVFARAFREIYYPNALQKSGFFIGE